MKFRNLASFGYISFCLPLFSWIVGGVSLWLLISISNSYLCLFIGILFSVIIYYISHFFTTGVISLIQETFLKCGADLFLLPYSYQIQGALRAHQSAANFDPVSRSSGSQPGRPDTLEGPKWPLSGSAETKFPHYMPNSQKSVWVFFQAFAPRE